MIIEPSNKLFEAPVSLMHIANKQEGFRNHPIRQ